jgi:hypothetical protein
MLSKRSKIEQFPESREDRFLAASAAASLCRTRTKLCGRFLVIRYGPSHWRAWDAPEALKNLVHLPEKTFSTTNDPQPLFARSSAQSGLIIPQITAAIYPT